MPYTLAMAAHPKIKTAPDGVAEVSMTDARAALTPFIREVSWGQRTGAFTERGKRVAVVLSADSYEDAELGARIVRAIRRAPQEERERIMSVLEPFMEPDPGPH